MAVHILLDVAMYISYIVSVCICVATNQVSRIGNQVQYQEQVRNNFGRISSPIISTWQCSHLALPATIQAIPAQSVAGPVV